MVVANNIGYLLGFEIVNVITLTLIGMLIMKIIGKGS